MSGQVASQRLPQSPKHPNTQGFVHRTDPGLNPGWMHNVPVPPRFLTLQDVAEILNVSASQAYALVRSGDLRAVKLGGRGQWRVEQAELEAFIQRSYSATEQFITEHPYGVDSGVDSQL